MLIEVEDVERKSNDFSGTLFVKTVYLGFIQTKEKRKKFGFVATLFLLLSMQ